MTRLLGAHLSIAGGSYKALESIKSMGGNCLQMFASSPRTWSNSKISKSDILSFLILKHKYDIRPIFFHATYLINLADPGQTGTKSVTTLIDALNLAPKLEIKGSIVHTGSFKKDELRVANYEFIRERKEYKTLLSNILYILDNTPQESLLILENAGNRKIGQTIDQLAKIIEDVNNPRVRACLDTCHLHAAGYDLRTKQRFETFLNEFDRMIGLEKLAVVHMNDSRDSLGDLRDRHENIGEGQVGIEVFSNFLNNPHTKYLPFIIETPGFDKKGPDKKNLKILKGLIV